MFPGPIVHLMSDSSNVPGVLEHSSLLIPSPYKAKRPTSLETLKFQCAVFVHFEVSS
jgi:hypothetical protein